MRQRVTKPTIPCQPRLRLLSIAIIQLACSWAMVSSSFAQSPFSDPSHVNGARFDTRPYVLILPGILGEQMWDRRIEQGIRQAQFACNVEIYDWTKGPVMMLSNIGGDRQEVEYLVRRISTFKQAHPQRPLILIGHSGGCRMVIGVLEALQRNRFVDRAVLLSPGLESAYDLRSAMEATRRGIVAFHSKLDFPISAPLTFARGLTRLRLDASAATFGFQVPATLNEPDRAMYLKLLRQREYRSDMLVTGNAGGHFGWTVPKFVSSHIVPLLK